MVAPNPDPKMHGVPIAEGGQTSPAKAKFSPTNETPYWRKCESPATRCWSGCLVAPAASEDPIATVAPKAIAYAVCGVIQESVPVTTCSVPNWPVWVGHGGLEPPQRVTRPATQFRFRDRTAVWEASRKQLGTGPNSLFHGLSLLFV